MSEDIGDTLVQMVVQVGAGGDGVGAGRGRGRGHAAGGGVDVQEVYPREQAEIRKQRKRVSRQDPHATSNAGQRILS